MIAPSPHEELVERLTAKLEAAREGGLPSWDACCAILSEISAAGLRIVPVRADAKMVDAGLAATAAWKGIAGSALTVNEEKMRLRYAAAVAAAPDYLGVKE